MMSESDTNEDKAKRVDMFQGGVMCTEGMVCGAITHFIFLNFSASVRFFWVERAQTKSTHNTNDNEYHTIE